MNKRKKCPKEMSAVVVIIYLFNFPDPENIIIKTNLIRFLCMLGKEKWFGVSHFVCLYARPIKKERTDGCGKYNESWAFSPSTYTHTHDSYIVDYNCCVWHVSANEKVCLHLIELIMRNYIFSSGKYSSESL